MNKQHVTLAVTLTLLLLSATTTYASTPIADVVFGPSGIEFTMKRSAEAGVSLTATGPDGFVLQTEFKSGEVPYIGLVTASGDALKPGVYNWEMTLNHRTPEGDRSTVSLKREDSKQSGVFTITPDGRLADPDAIEGGFLKDQVIADDLIVDGSACIGFDCVNGESFGFDTLRLKENSVRIKFEDTSTNPSFPTNDWQLTANSSASGGQNKFSIDDIDSGRAPFTIEAGAPSHSLYVDDGGRVGIGTSTPVVEAHLVEGDTPTVRLEQSGSSGFAPQIFDIAGNDANFFVRDVTNGSTLPFRIRPGAGTSALDISADDDIGLGTASPDARLHINSRSSNTTELLINNDGGSNGSASGSLRIDVGANNAEVISILSSDGQELFNLFETSGTGAVLSMFDSGENERFRIATTGGSNHFSGNLGIGCNNATADLTVNSSVNAGTTACGGGTESTMNAGDTAFVVTSSRSYKENLEPVVVDDVLSKIVDIEVYNYDFIDGPKDRVGLMAEDFHQVFGRGSDKRLSGQEVQMALWLAIKELTQRNEALESELLEIKALVAGSAE